MTSRVLETVLTGRNLLSPVLATAARDVTAFNSTVGAANDKAAASSAASARVQQASATTSASATGKAAAAATAGAGTQSAAAEKIAASNVKASTSASASAQQQSRAHAKAAESATVAARVQETANRSLAASNGLLGTSLTPLTAGLGAVGLGLAYAGYRGMEFDSAMSQVQAASQETGATLDQLSDAAVKAGADTQYSAVEAAQGITEMSKAGVDARDILGGGLTGALNLAAAGQISVAEAAETGATALSVFRLEGNQMSHVADLLAAGAGKAQGSVGDLSAALNQSALVASQAGLSIEDTTGALAMFASNGLIGSDAGTSFKTMLQALTPNSLAASKAMDAIGFSAFDARGQFVGMESVAGQLRAGLAGLTEEQRNTTLETIFGSDAVRAASVLYKEGAAGVAQWATNVDDAGYAQRQAAQLTDNLRGDLERLGGAFDSVMTTIGGGAQGPLRWVVQALTEVVAAGGDVIGFFTSLPGPVQASLVALVAVHTLAGPLSAGLKGVGFALNVLTASAAAGGGSMAALRGGMSGLLGLMGGPVGLTIAASTVAIGYMVEGLVNMGEATVDTASYQQQLASALEQSKGAIDDNVRALAAQQAATTMVGSDTSLLDYARRAGIDLALVTDALLGNRDAADQVTSGLDRYLEAQATAGQARGVDAATIAEWAEKNNIAKDAIGQLIPVLGDAQTKNADLAEATGQSGAATAAAVDPAEELATQLQGVSDAASNSKKQIDLYKTSLDVLNGAHITAVQAEADFYAAIDAADGALKNMTGSVLNAAGGLDTQSEAGRATFDTLVNLKGSADQWIATLIEQGATADQANAKDGELRRSFYETALQMTGSREAAERLTNQIYGIPGERNTTITADTKQASDAATALQRQIDALKGREIIISARTSIAGNLNGLNGVLPAGGMATGGPVVGPGTGTSDTAGLYALSNGEHVWTAAEVAAAGGHTGVEELRREVLANGHGLASGGPVGDIPLTVDMSAVANAIAAVQKLTVATPAAGGGPIGSGWQALFNATKAAFPEARANSTYRPGDPGFHGSGRAVDLGRQGMAGGSGHPYLAAMNRWWYDNYGTQLAELIYDGAGDDRPDLKNGRPHTYSAATRAQHRNHVHVARANGGPVWPGQDFLVGERGAEIVRMNGTGTVIPADRTATMLAPASMPGYGAPASMPGYGAAGAGTGATATTVTVAAPNVTVVLDGREIRSIARVEAGQVVVEAFTGADNRGRFNG